MGVVEALSFLTNKIKKISHMRKVWVEAVSMGVVEALKDQDPSS